MNQKENTDFNTLSIRAQSVLKRCGFTDKVKLIDAFWNGNGFLYSRFKVANCGRKTYTEILDFINLNLFITR